MNNQRFQVTMKTLIFRISLCLLESNYGLSQNDTINQLDESGRKQGHWIYYGNDRPAAGYPDSGIIEEGPYINNRKEGIWIKYNIDGTPRLKGEYRDNRPHSIYTKGGGSHSSSQNFNHLQGCTTVRFDSIRVQLNYANSYGPITDTSAIIYFNDNAISNYIDSISHLDKNFQAVDGEFCSHALEIRIDRYLNGTTCTTRFNTCYARNDPARIARECAEKVFGFE
jgi:hypothetical protein